MTRFKKKNTSEGS